MVSRLPSDIQSIMTTIGLPISSPETVEARILGAASLNASSTELGIKPGKPDLDFLAPAW
tara:strand:- start:752 stop:931 length:180 start_codon:yes stop_codon:yes gene_type:complete